MKYNNMICDVELLKKSSLKINEISKTGDEIIRMMQTQIESIANDHWTGEESRKYLAEYDVLQNSYNRLKSRLTWMEQTMESFAIKVEDFDN
ncbi:MAG: WXG100 family type VII secretion target, partial [Oscillospiraceae bacterium]|nr:WXG100 family type VII secretion target [Oscillospiraceae bacterium]